jgi:hypothetical protein
VLSAIACAQQFMADQNPRVAGAKNNTASSSVSTLALRHTDPRVSAQIRASAFRSASLEYVGMC